MGGELTVEMLASRFPRGFAIMASGISSSLVAGPAPLPIQTNAAASAAGGSPSAALPSDQQSQNALQALKILKQVGASAGDGAKGAAMQKLAVLKARLKALMMLGGDPKQRAQEAAAIAKEIASAAQDYAQAGGSSSDVAAAAGTAPATGAPAANGPAAAGTAPQNAIDAAAGTTEAVTNTAPAAPSPTATNAQTAAGPIDGAKGGNAPTTGGSSQADQAFMQEARNLARQAKAIIDAAIQALKRKHQQADPGVAGAGAAAVKAVDAAADTLGGSSTAGYGGPSSAPAAPVVSITA